jgi:hypothetical protein
MAEENPISPISDAEPPKVNPIKPAVGSTLKLNPVVRKPAVGGATSALKPGLKLPPKPGATVSALRPGLKLPPKPGTATQSALKPGLKLPPRPQIRKPGETVAAAPVPKPVIPAAAPAPAADDAVKPVEPPKSVEAPKPVEVPKPVEAVKPAVEPVKPVVEAVKPVAKIDAAGVAKLPTVEAPSVKRDEPIVTSEPPKPMEALKSVTQKLKGITQSIPQQAILHKTGIIADSAVSETQKEAAKHKTARISLADAIGAAPVKNENAPMKTIRIKRPIDIPGATKTAIKPETAPAEDADEAVTQSTIAMSEPSSSVTQRKTLKIARPATGAVRPSKFGVKRPSAATAAPVAPSASAESDSAAAPAGEVADIPEIADIPPMPTVAAIPVAASASNDGPAWLCALSAIVQLAACIAIGALAWYLFQDTQISTF